MAKIVKLGALLPEDIVFEMPGGQRVSAPGDPPLDLILKIAELFERSENEEDPEAFGIDVLRELDDEVLRLLRMRDPDIESSPFGVIGVQHFVAELLKQYNFGTEGADEPADPPKRAARKRSTRSSGSRSS